MANKKTFTVPVKGSVLFVQKGLGNPVKITAVGGTATDGGKGSAITLTAPGLGAKYADVVSISGVSGLDGFYPVAKVAGDTITLVNELYIENVPTLGDNPEARLVQFYEEAFCDVRGYQYGGPSKTDVDVSTVCPERPSTEPGDIEYDNLTLSVWKVPDDVIQRDLRNKFQSDERFAVKLRYAGRRGYSYFAGYLQQAPGFSGNAGDKLESDINIKMTQFDFWLPAEEESAPTPNPTPVKNDTKKPEVETK